MKKTIIINLVMRPLNETSIIKYINKDPLIKTSTDEVRYPITAYLKENLKYDDEPVFIMVCKVKEGDTEEKIKEKTKDAEKEITEACSVAGIDMAGVRMISIKSPFLEEQDVYEDLLLKIVESIEPGSELYMDITFGPKDIPIVMMSALNFATKFLGCSIGRILYGQAFFEKGNAVKANICDISPLFVLNSLNDMICANEPERALEILRKLINL